MMSTNFILKFKMDENTGAPAGFRFGEWEFRGSASWGARGAEPPEAGEFSKIFQKFINCEKFIILAYFSKKLTNNSLIFLAFGRKTQ